MTAVRLLALTFFAFLVLVAYWADTGSMPAAISALAAFPGGDRVGHLVLYGILAYVLSLAFPTRRVGRGRISLPLGVVLAAVFASLEEASQLFVDTRTPDLVDLSMGYLGICLLTFIPCMRTACSPAEK